MRPRTHDHQSHIKGQMTVDINAHESYFSMKKTIIGLSETNLRVFMVILNSTRTTTVHRSGADKSEVKFIFKFRQEVTYSTKYLYLRSNLTSEAKMKISNVHRS